MNDFVHQLPAVLADLERAERSTPAWLQDQRRKALEAFTRAGLPSTHEEAWRHTDLGRLNRTAVALPAPDAVQKRAALEAALERLALPEAAARLVFANGRLVPELSSFDGLPDGVRVRPLSRALAESPELLESTLKREQLDASRPFAQLGAALLSEGAVIEASNGSSCELPIQLVFLTSPSTSTGHASDSAAQLSAPRVLLRAGERSQLSLVEVFASTRGGATSPAAEAVTIASTDLLLERGASVQHHRLQLEAASTLHFGALDVHQTAGSRLTSHAFSFGAALSRVEISSSLEGEGAECTLNGLYVASGRQHLDHQTLIDHRSARCTSRELYKGILAGQAHGIFDGLIHVRPGAQKTDARQGARNLVLSDSAVVHAQPRLEIHADDVKCAHGATVGRLDETALFYLRSRGIPRPEAQELLIRAFAREIVDAVEAPALQALIGRLLGERLTEALHPTAARPGANGVES